MHRMRAVCTAGGRGGVGHVGSTAGERGSTAGGRGGVKPVGGTACDRGGVGTAATDTRGGLAGRDT